MCTDKKKKSDIDRVLRPLGISLLQANILHVVDESPSSSLTVNEIKGLMADDSPNVSRSLNKLMENNYIIKERSTEDQRIVNIVITDEGKQMHRLADEAIAPLTSLGLKEEELKHLYNLLAKIK